MTAATQKVYQDILQLSSGTIANLTGSRDYTSIDYIRLDFASFVKIMGNHNRHQFDTWVEAWDCFLDYLTRPSKKGKI